MITLAVRPEREGKRGGLGGELGDALPFERGAPRDGTAERSVGADHLGNGGLGHTVLTGAERAVLFEEGFEKIDHFRIVLLFGH